MAAAWLELKMSHSPPACLKESNKQIMPQISNHYFTVINRRNWRTWCFSAFTALSFNLALFLLMTYLTHKAPSQTQFTELVPQVNIIRLKHQDSKIKPKKPKTSKLSRKKLHQQKKMDTKPLLQTNLSLPFTLTPRLPQGPTTLNLPPLVNSLPQNLAAPADIFSLDQLDAPLTTLTRMPPIYPLRAKRRGVEGWVKVGFVVEKNGSVNSVTVIKAQPDGYFEQNVIRCVRSWRFKPGTIAGVPVRTRVETTIRFNLDQEK
jgi:protein TonB